MSVIVNSVNRVWYRGRRVKCLMTGFWVGYRVFRFARNLLTSGLRDFFGSYLMIPGLYLRVILHE